MNLTPTEMNEPGSDSLVVEFYPSVDDYVHIGQKMNASIKTPPIIQYAYQGFLITNAVVFPVFLWYNDYFLIAILVLALNIVALSWLIPWFTRDGYREYYKQVVGPRENDIARVELNTEGIRYTADDGESFWPWRRITEIEETDDAIFFFFAGNGLAVRKSGFAYRGEQDDFTRFARTQLAGVRQHQIEQ